MARGDDSSTSPGDHQPGAGGSPLSPPSTRRSFSQQVATGFNAGRYPQLAGDNVNWIAPPGAAQDLDPLVLADAGWLSRRASVETGRLSRRASADNGSRPMTPTLSRRTSGFTEMPEIPDEDVPSSAPGLSTYWPSVKMELHRTLLMAVPLLINNVANFGVTIIIISYVGHLGSHALACATLGGSLFNVMGQSLFIGCAATLETLCGQAVGAGKFGLVGLEMMRCMFLMTVSMPFFGVLYHYMGDILIAIGQDPEVATGAATYLERLTPALWMMGMTECLKRALTSRGIVLPNMTIALFTTVCTPFYAWLFITYFGLGFVGGAYAVMAGYMSNVLCFLGVFLYINWRTYGTDEYAWPGWSWDMCSGLHVIIKIGFPTTMMICLDWWTWETMILLAGLLPNPSVSVAVMGLGFNIVALCFMVPLAFTAAASIGIANFLGANQPKRARLAHYMGMALASILMTFICIAIFSLRKELGLIYTDDPEVLEELGHTMPIISIILWGDGFQNICSAALRGSGRQAVGATINLSALWLFGVPLSVALAFHFKLGVQGFWYGLLAAFTLQAMVMVITVLLAIDFDTEARRAQQRLLERTVSVEVDGVLAANDSVQEPLLNRT